MGSTRRCLVKYGDQSEIHLTFSANGWNTKDVMVAYLQWLSGQIGGMPCCLILDVYAAHLADCVWEVAEALDIELITVPANGTGQYQPLDYRIFGILKSFARQEFMRLTRINEFEETDRMAAHTLSVCWHRLSRDEIRAAWKCILPNYEYTD